MPWSADDSNGPSEFEGQPHPAESVLKVRATLVTPLDDCLAADYCPGAGSVH